MIKKEEKTMAEKMLVTQALDERDLLVKKINDKITRASFVDIVKPNEAKVIDAKVTRDEFKQNAESSYQQIMDLIARFQKIDAAIVASNAVTKISTSYGEFTVAGAISLRSRLKATDPYKGKADFEGVLAERMGSVLDEMIKRADFKNQKLEATAEDMRLSILGKDSKAKDDKPLEVVEAYIKENTTEIVDPLDVRKKVEAIKEKRSALISELETQIKVANATTFIEI